MAKLPRFYVSPLSGDTPHLEIAPVHRVIALPPAVIQHAVKTLRMRAGDKLILFDGSGREYRAELQLKDGKTYTARVEESFPGKPPDKPLIFLYQAPIKKERWEWLIEKATELGVRAITPLLTKYVEVDITQNFEKKRQRWEMIAQSACEQSERSTLPILNEPVAFKERIQQAPKPALFFYEGEAEPVTRVLSTLAQPESVSIFVGPVGGFAPEEAEYAKSQGALLVSLGQRVLRCETAALAALAVIRQR